jgi:hypothetical protein
MDKERLMQFLSDAIDMGFDIEIRYPHSDISKEQAQALAERFSKAVGSDVKETEGKHNTWLEVKSKEGWLHGSFFHADSMKKSVLAE